MREEQLGPGGARRAVELETGRIYRRTANYRHRLVVNHAPSRGATTLFATGRREKAWGFEKNGKIVLVDEKVNARWNREGQTS